MILIAATGLFVLGLVPGYPQDDASAGGGDDAQASRAALAKRVAKAHRPGGNKEKIDRYRAEIQITQLGPAKDTIDIALGVLYGSKIERKPGKTMSMIRYSVHEDGQRRLQGMDAKGKWTAIGESVTPLRGKNLQADAARLARHLRLCKLLLRYLDPGEILRSLIGDEAVTERLLPSGRKKIKTLYMRGLVEDFPIFRDGDGIGHGTVFMEVWIDKKTARLVALRVFPTDKSGRPGTQGEMIRLQKYADKGVMIPQQLYFYGIDKKVTKPAVKVTIKSCTLNPPLTKSDFRRPKR